MHKTKYNIGQIVSHIKQGYRGVIIDVDSSFQPSGVHSPIMMKKNIANDHPWYRILVDNSSQITYVKETLLSEDDQHIPISHPDLEEYLDEINGVYIHQYRLN